MPDIVARGSAFLFLVFWFIGMPRLVSSVSELSDKSSAIGAMSRNKREGTRVLCYY